MYRMAAVDHRGRVADRHITAELNWDAGTRLSIREHNGLLVVTADPHGVFTPCAARKVVAAAHAAYLYSLITPPRIWLRSGRWRKAVEVMRRCEVLSDAW